MSNPISINFYKELSEFLVNKKQELSRWIIPHTEDANLRISTISHIDSLLNCINEKQ